MNQKTTVTAIVKRINQPAEVIKLNDNLKEYQNIVGGYIECIPFPDDDNLTITLNDEGKLENLEPTLVIPEYRDVIAGNFVITADGGNGNATDLTDEQIKKVFAYLKTNEVNHLTMKEAVHLMYQMEPAEAE